MATPTPKSKDLILRALNWKPSAPWIRLNLLMAMQTKLLLHLGWWWVVVGSGWVGEGDKTDAFICPLFAFITYDRVNHMLTNCVTSHTRRDRNCSSNTKKYVRLCTW